MGYIIVAIVVVFCIVSKLDKDKTKKVNKAQEQKNHKEICKKNADERMKKLIDMGL